MSYLRHIIELAFIAIIAAGVAGGATVYVLSQHDACNCGSHCSCGDKK